MTEFKVGDRVERINVRWKQGFNGPNIEIGDRGVVTHANRTGGINVALDKGGVQNNATAANYQLLSQEIVVGSRVAYENYGAFRKTMFGTVNRIDERLGLAWADDWTVGSEDGYVRLDKLRLARPGEEAPKELYAAPTLPRIPHPQTAGTYIVVKAEDGKLLPNAEPRVHFTAADAKKVAARLAGKHGGVFLVMVAAFRSEGTPETTYVVKTTSV